MFESESLTLMNGDGPSQAQRILRKSTLHLGFNLFGFLVNHIPRVLPHLPFHRNIEFVALAMHQDAIIINRLHLTNAPIIILMSRRSVVAHKHHLRTFLQHQVLARGITILWERAPYLGCKAKCGFFYGRQLLLIIMIGHSIVRRQPNIARFLRRNKVGLIACVQCRKIICCSLAITHMIQNAQEGFVLLPINLLQLNRHIRNLCQSMAIEEVGRGVMSIQQHGVFVGHHGRELLQVAYHQQLHATKRLQRISKPSQHGINGI